MILEIENDDVVLDDGIFFCCQDTLNLSIHTNTNVSTGLLGGEGFRQPKVSGSGVLILETKVPFEEIIVLYPYHF